MFKGFQEDLLSFYAEIRFNNNKTFNRKFEKIVQHVLNK